MEYFKKRIMKKGWFVIIALCVVPHFLAAQFTYRGLNKEREVKSGSGQEFDSPFTRIPDFHFVQFAVYPASTNPDKLMAPKGIGEVWLIYHRDTKIKNQYGAFYIVKAFQNLADAKTAIATYKRLKINCWYNKDLTGATFELVGVATEDFQVQALPGN